MNLPVSTQCQSATVPTAVPIRFRQRAREIYTDGAAGCRRVATEYLEAFERTTDIHLQSFYLVRASENLREANRLDAEAKEVL